MGPAPQPLEPWLGVGDEAGCGVKGTIAVDVCGGGGGGGWVARLLLVLLLVLAAPVLKFVEVVPSVWLALGLTCMWVYGH